MSWCVWRWSVEEDMVEVEDVEVVDRVVEDDPVCVVVDDEVYVVEVLLEVSVPLVVVFD